MSLKEYKPGTAFTGVIGRTCDVIVGRVDIPLTLGAAVGGSQIG
jgi:hypothetical protein